MLIFEFSRCFQYHITQLNRWQRLWHEMKVEVLSLSHCYFVVDYQTNWILLRKTIINHKESQFCHYFSADFCDVESSRDQSIGKSWGLNVWHSYGKQSTNSVHTSARELIASHCVSESHSCVYRRKVHQNVINSCRRVLCVRCLLSASLA